MTANTKAIYTQLKHNPEFLSEICETMADAICKLIAIADMEIDGDEKTEIFGIASQLARDRLDVRKLLQ